MAVEDLSRLDTNGVADLRRCGPPRVESRYWRVSQIAICLMDVKYHAP